MACHSSKDESANHSPPELQPPREYERVAMTRLSELKASSANSTRNLRMRHVMDVIQNVRKKLVGKIADEALHKAMK